MPDRPVHGVGAAGRHRTGPGHRCGKPTAHRRIGPRQGHHDRRIDRHRRWLHDHGPGRRNPRIRIPRPEDPGYRDRKPEHHQRRHGRGQDLDRRGGRRRIRRTEARLGHRSRRRRERLRDDPDQEREPAEHAGRTCGRSARVAEELGTRNVQQLVRHPRHGLPAGDHRRHSPHHGGVPATQSQRHRGCLGAEGRLGRHLRCARRQRRGARHHEAGPGRTGQGLLQRLVHLPSSLEDAQAGQRLRGHDALQRAVDEQGGRRQHHLHRG